MRRAVLVAAPVLALLLGGCGTTVDGVAVPAGSAGTTHVSAPPAVPPTPTAAKEGTCPFLPASEVSYDTGERVGTVKVSEVPAGQPYPMCFFYRASNGSLEVTARVYTGSAAVATALVNQAAPIATSNPASQPAGWTGGAQASKNGAVYAVAKGGTAIVVTSNRTFTVYCRQITNAVAGYLQSH